MNLFNPDTSSFESFYDKRRYLLAWRFTILFSIVFLFLSILFLSINPEASLIYFVVTLLSATMMAYIYLTKKFMFPYWVFTISASLLVTYTLNFMDNSLHYADFIWMVAIVLVTFIGLGKTIGYATMTYHAISSLYFVFFRLNINLTSVKQLGIYEKIGASLEVIFAFVLIGFLFRLYLQLKDHSEFEMRKANDELNQQVKLVAAKNEENITLVKEIHHRVKNNLQIVISLLRMQSYEMTSEETQKQFREAINRIMAISLIHQKLYQEKQLSYIRFDSYFDDLIQEIKTLYPQSIDIQVDYDPKLKEIGLKTVVPLGLLMNELMTNSFKHGLQGNSGSIKIAFNQQSKEKILLQYSDSGSWDENSEYNGFGMELIDLLTEQMEGKMERENSFYQFSLKNMDLY